MKVITPKIFNMITHTNPRSLKVRRTRKGGGTLINTLINKLPFELHLPGYNYCGPGTKLHKRLARGDKGINPLDEACKIHDIAYNDNKNLESRHKADLQLASAAEQRWRESNSLSERLAAFAVDKIMKFKVKRGMGVTMKKLISASRKAVRKYVKGVKKGGKRPSNSALLKVATKTANCLAKGKIVKPHPRIIPIPKKGGFLPLIPLLAALGAAGSLAGGVSTVAKNIYDVVKSKKNDTSSKVVGKGLYIAPYKKGMGLYLSPTKKN